MSGDERDFNNIETRAVIKFFFSCKAKASDLPKGQTINTEYYLSLLVQLKDILKAKRCGKVIKVVLFLYDNAPTHRALATQKKLAFLGFQYLDHLPYSPDLAPSDYHLLPGLKKTIESSPFFVRLGGRCLRGDLVLRTIF